jgi:SET domain-containing protein
VRMEKSLFILLVFAAVMLASGSVVPGAAEIPAQPVLVLKASEELDKRTVIKPSMIPNAGNGLFAVVRIKKGDVIGELGGRFVPEEEDTTGNHYIAGISECAWGETYPYTRLDASRFGANVSRINFAPSKINGIDTNFQNAEIRRLCIYPYFVFAALRDIEPGEEIWASYGPSYDYDRFMNEPDVRDFFCGLLNVNCSEDYRYEH